MKLIPLLHYALNPSGILFLGSSETTGEFQDLFDTLDRKYKLYQRKENLHGARHAPLGQVLYPLIAQEETLPRATGRTAFTKKIPVREITERALLAQVAPTGALVRGNGDILYLHGRTGRYLEVVPGEAGTNNILKMAREGLRRELTKALQKAKSAKEVVRCTGLHVKTNGSVATLNLTVSPVLAGLAGLLKPGSISTPEIALYLVILEETPSSESEQTQQASHHPGISSDRHSETADTDVRIVALRQALSAKEEHLQAANEELESANEELQSSNEEMQSVNEELQSTNEELETSKEELQSVNEELATVNNELQTKVADLSRANNDMNNLLAGTGIGTVFVDHQMRILRFTPTATRIINLILSDVGRPVGHIVSNFVGYDNLVTDTQTVLDTLIPKELSAQTVEGRWYSIRILPYRTVNNVIEGAVITFIDISEMKEAEEKLQQVNDMLRLAVIMRDAHDAITVQDLDGCILAWNPGAVRMYGWSEVEAMEMNVRELIPEGLREEALATVHKLSLAEKLLPYRTQRIAKDGSVVKVWLTATALVDESGRMYAIATTERAQESKDGSDDGDAQ